MKSILIVGLGRFGHHLCMSLVEKNNEVMIVDGDEECLKDLLPYVTTAKVGDCTDVNVLKSLGIGNFDICFVCIGENFQSSLEITNLIKELGAKYVISKADSDIHAKFLLRNGADEVIYPDRDIAEKVAVRHSTTHVFDYAEIAEGYLLTEIQPIKEWIGRTVKQTEVRTKYNVSILGTKKNGQVKMLPGADYIFNKDDHLMILGLKEDVDKVLDRLR